MGKTTDTDEHWYEALGEAILARDCPTALEGVNADAARVEAGVRIYRNNVRSAYGRALGDIFPVIKRLVGEEFFKALAAAYFDAHPPRARLVARYGDAFPRFLERFEPVEHLPYLADVARLELAWLASYHSAEAPVISAEEALEIGGTAPETLRLTPHPALRLYASERGGFSIWRHNKLEAPGALSVTEPREWALIVRPEAEVLVTPVSQAVHDCVAALIGGATLGEALEVALDVDAAAEPAAILHTIFTIGAITKAQAQT